MIHNATFACPFPAQFGRVSRLAPPSALTRSLAGESTRRLLLSFRVFNPPMKRMRRAPGVSKLDGEYCRGMEEGWQGV